MGAPDITPLTEEQAAKLNEFGALLRELNAQHGLDAIQLGYTTKLSLFTAYAHDKHEAFAGQRIYSGSHCVNGTPAEQIASAIRKHAAQNPNDLTRLRELASEAVARAERLKAELAAIEAEAA